MLFVLLYVSIFLNKEFFKTSVIEYFKKLLILVEGTNLFPEVFSNINNIFSEIASPPSSVVSYFLILKANSVKLSIGSVIINSSEFIFHTPLYSFGGVE